MRTTILTAVLAGALCSAAAADDTAPADSAVAEPPRPRAIAPT